MAITFVDGLVIFAVALTILFTATLMAFRDREVNKGDLQIMNVTRAKKLLIASIGLGLIILYLELSTNFRTEYSMIYYTLITIMGALMVMPIIISNTEKLTKLALPSIMIMHIDILYAELPASGISLGEGSEMVKAMYLLDRWYFTYAHNPTYNPLPSTAYIIVSMAKILNLPWYSSIPWIIYYPTFIITYDLIMYVLTYYLTRNELASLIATLLVNTTPEVALTLNPYQYLSDMLMLITLIAFIRFIAMKKDAKSMVIATVAYTAAIISLTTAIQLVLIPPTLLLIEYLMNKISRKSPINTTNHLTVKAYETTLFFILITAITTVIATYTPGYFLYTYSILAGYIGNTINYLLSPHTFKPSEIALPLFDRAGVSPIQGYAWSLAIALATAYILTETVRLLIRKRSRINSWHLTLYLAAVIPVIIGFTGRVLGTGSSNLTAASYVALSMILPVSGYAALKVIKKGIITSIILILALILIIPIAAHDPNVSPIEYAKIHQAPITNPPKDMYNMAFSIINLLPKHDTNTAIIIYSKPILKTLGYSPSIGYYPTFTNIPSGVMDAALYITNTTNINILIGANYTTYYAGYYINEPPHPIITYVPANLIFSINLYDTKIFLEG